MKKAFIISVVIITIAVYSFAEDWKLSVDASLMLTQNAYSDSWVGGEVGSLTWTSGLNSLAAKQLHPKVYNKNTLKLSFGQTHTQEQNTKRWLSPVKSTDLIDLESLLQFTLGGFVDPFISGRMESQFLDGSDTLKVRYVNPIVFTEALGITKVFLKEEKRDWNARLAGALRQRMNRDKLDLTTTDPLDRKSETTNDGGIMFIHEFRSPLLGEKINFSSKLTLFQALFYSKSKDLKGLPNEDYWKMIDVNFENIFSASITKYIMVNLYTQLLYDKEIDLRTRIKQTLSLGLTYKMI